MWSQLNIAQMGGCLWVPKKDGVGWGVPVASWGLDLPPSHLPGLSQLWPWVGNLSLMCSGDGGQGWVSWQRSQVLQHRATPTLPPVLPHLTAAVAASPAPGVGRGTSGRHVICPIRYATQPLSHSAQPSVFGCPGLPQGGHPCSTSNGM